MRDSLPAPADPPWRAVPAGSLHVTLAFLGAVEDFLVERVRREVRDAMLPVGAMRTSRAVGLPPRRPRVLAVELEDPSGRAVALQRSVAGALEGAGLYEPERRSWLPHVTIARVRGRMPAPRDAPLPEVTPVEFTPPSVTVYQSLLHPHGARYEALERVPLQPLG